MIKVAKIILKKPHKGKIPQGDFQMYHGAIIIKIVWFFKKQIAYQEDNRQSKINCVHRSLIYDKDDILVSKQEHNLVNKQC